MRTWCLCWLCSPFTVESHSPYSYLPFGASAASSDTDTESGLQADPGLAAGDSEAAVIEALYRSPICDSGGRTVLEVIDHERWPEGRLATHGVTCTQPGRDTEITAALMIAAPDVTVIAELVKRAAIEAHKNAPDCQNLIAVGFAFDPDVPTTVNVCKVHRVVGSKDLQYPSCPRTPTPAPSHCSASPTATCVEPQMAPAWWCASTAATPTTPVLASCAKPTPMTSTVG